MTNEERAGHLWYGLNDCRAIDPDITVATVTHWLEYHGAGMPDPSYMNERLREDAKTWALCAHQHELEAYLAAAIMELERTPLTDRAAKRLAALAYRAMNSEDQAKFREWVQK